MKKIFSPSSWNRKYLFGMIPLLLVLVGGGYWFRVLSQRESLAARVPASAIGYIETTSLADLLNGLSETPAWLELLRLAGGPERSGSNLLAELGQWGLPIPGDEIAALSRSQLAVVVTGIEVSDQQVRPRMALLIETRWRSDRADKVLAGRVRQLAGNLYNGDQSASQGVDRLETYTDRYAGIEVVGYYPRGEANSAPPERGLFTARVGSGWIIANHLDPLRQTIDGWLGRIPTLAGSFHWQLARRQLAGVTPGGEKALIDGIFGFISGDGIVRLLRSGVHVFADGSPPSALLAGALGDVATELATRTGEGLAFREEYGPEGAFTRYTVLLRPDLLDALRPQIRPVPLPPVGPAARTALEMLPADLTDLTVYRVESPNQVMAAIEAAVSARIGVGQSFLLHQFLTAARDSFFGRHDDSIINAAIGDEILEAGLAGDPGERLWMLRVRDRSAMARLAGSFLPSGQGRTRSPEIRKGIEVFDSGDARRGAAAVIGEYLVLAPSNRLRKMIDELGVAPGGADGLIHPLIGTAPRATGSPLIIGYSRGDAGVDGGALMAMIPLLRLTAGRPILPHTTEGTPELGAEIAARRVQGLPSTLRTVTLTSVGVEIDSRSPLGTLPLLVGILEGATHGPIIAD